ncbi:transposase [Pseudomonas umsongensis]|jgi:REP element-mobilizing transposase RayT|uniref:Transposase n=1 Tax=Pseudomonas umsongensis TaxID=198618 RepID=A0AAE6ZU08_9PSED|nr:transposase [Pseudomonas umsongensis]MBT9571801.1 transposase [Pseudomonas umsongensis]OXR34835.1 transposase [Pseudomonas umsongensis]QFG30485.1 transposase [Pseudomonas umsongensis]QJC79367.1 transposase [Pseudomonas umsongensis]SDT10693.1 REP element-mobilizing transposase RayT [Pseudomonas umsongensis]
MPTIHQAHRLRTGRFSAPGQIYLVTTVVQNRDPVFRDFMQGRLVVDALKKAQEEELVLSLAWVVMPDHLHWLFELKNNTLTCIMARTKSRITLALNRSLERDGSLWQHGFHDRAIRRDEDLPAVARYIVANPLRAGLVEKIGDYPLWDAVWL